MVRMTKVRAFVAAVFAIVVLAVFVAIAGRILGFDIPGLSKIPDAIGM